MEKKYLAKITSPRGVCVTVAYYADTPCKNYRIYYCGVDTGARYERLSNAARRIQKYADDWATFGGVSDVKKEFLTASEIPRRGSNA